MINYIKGKIVLIQGDYIILDNNGIGYSIYFRNQAKVHLNDEVIIYTYMHVREDELSLYGFLSLKEYDLFMKLISVKGLGPKTAISAIGFATSERLIEAIEKNDLPFIKKLPGVGAKTASQIILDLQGKLVKEETASSRYSQEIEDALEGLKALGLSASEIGNIGKVLSEKPGLTSGEYLKMALQINNKRKLGGK